jgi:hypothetical protein
MTSDRRTWGEMTVGEFQAAYVALRAEFFDELIDQLTHYPTRMTGEQLNAYSEALVALVRVLVAAGDPAATAYLDRVRQRDTYKAQIDWLITFDARWHAGDTVVLDGERYLWLDDDA